MTHLFNTHPVAGDYVYTGFESDGSYGMIGYDAQAPRYMLVRWYNADDTFYTVSNHHKYCFDLNEDGTWTLRGDKSYGYTEDDRTMIEFKSAIALLYAYYVVISTWLDEEDTRALCAKYGEEF